MTKMVGTEPLESSHGDQSLLPTYMVNIVVMSVIRDRGTLAKFHCPGQSSHFSLQSAFEISTSQ